MTFMLSPQLNFVEWCKLIMLVPSFIFVFLTQTYPQPNQRLPNTQKSPIYSTDSRPCSKHRRPSLTPIPPTTPSTYYPTQNPSMFILTAIPISESKRLKLK